MSKVAEVRLTIAAIIYAIELDFKSLIIRYLTPFQNNLGFMGSVDLIKKTKDRYQKENPTINPEENIEEAIEYLDFGDFYQIILRNKSFFPDDLILNIKSMTPKFEELSAIRNRVMHTRPLLGGDFSTTYAFAKEMVEQQNNHWDTLSLTLVKIEKDPSYVLTPYNYLS
ncbi:hypothetical protein SAMN04487891_103184 [Flagellimonas taeanensis]|uniref:Swt1-like HEPN domain-containing protein n=1 Tax=Flagellimonas taeanensis TaxID=1005926 RepID=A0A1I1EL32_9FLAO|nr:hypothetical protein [Allomuricauda taeanensis]SFB87777.1 hypothetical protein SAMN04487891_103184 [Allomuricauda taeanensis]